MKQYEIFTQESQREREAILQFDLINRLKDYFDRNGYIYLSHYVTSEFESANYDLSITVQNKLTEKWLRVYIEVKTRTQVYDEYFLEEKKWKQMNKTGINIGGEFLLLYINFTPKGTFLWNITDYTKFNSKIIECKDKTSSKINEIKYVKKKQFLLPKESASKFDFIYGNLKRIDSGLIESKLNNDIPELDPEVESWLCSKKEKYNFNPEFIRIDEK